MATYEYECLACEGSFEQRRPMTAPVATALPCPACGSDRVRRRFSFVASTGASEQVVAGGACACGGACGCRG